MMAAVLVEAVMRRSAVLALVLAACAEPTPPHSTANDATAPISAPSLQPAPTFGTPVPHPDEPPQPPATTRASVAPSPVESPEQPAARTGIEPTRTLVETSAGAPANREIVKIGAKSERVKIATKPGRAKIGSMTGRVKVRSKADHEAVAATSPRVKIGAKAGRVRLDAKQDRVKIGSKHERERIGSKPQRVKIATQRAELGVVAPDAVAPATNPGTGSTESPRATPEKK